MTEENLTDDDLRLVARHGSGEFTKAIALVKLARRRGKLDVLAEHVDDVELDGGEPA